MIKETVTYIDYNGNEVTDELYFSLNKMEATMMAAKIGGDIATHMAKLQKENNLYEMMCLLRDIMLTAYGEKSSDTRQFIKTKEVTDRFAYSLAFAELFEALMSDEKRASKFGREMFATAMANAKGEQRAQLAKVIK